jgi:hypothetical protein
LAPDIVEAILVGSADQALVLERLERPLGGAATIVPDFPADRLTPRL